ncbi:MAG TPA: hypothetical protein VG455_12805 [Acidimicrobiales bacterium]|nr:hypothetical protein [Acidimicrobiales bacterium]
MTPVVAVVDAAWRQARLAEALWAASDEAGFDLQLRTQRQLAAEVSIDQSSAHEPIVDPDRPLLWLSPGDSAPAATRDDRFLGSEAYAAARSIALLTRAPVLNRPSGHSACGTFPPSAVLAVRQARHHDRGAVIRDERFIGNWLAEDGEETSGLEVHDYATGRSSFGRAATASGPFRRRAAVGGAEPVKVIVVGHRTLITADVDPAVLAASGDIARGYSLDLASVWWLIDEDGARRTLARIDCWPFDGGLGPDVDQVAVALLAWIEERLRVSAAAIR